MVIDLVEFMVGSHVVFEVTPRRRLDHFFGTAHDRLALRCRCAARRARGDEAFERTARLDHIQMVRQVDESDRHHAQQGLAHRRAAELGQFHQFRFDHRATLEARIIEHRPKVFFTQPRLQSPTGSSASLAHSTSWPGR